MQLIYINEIVSASEESVVVNLDEENGRSDSLLGPCLVYLQQ